METTSTISQTVMRRVRVVHAVRPFFSGSALALLVFIIALWAIGREVWVAHVFRNLALVAHGGDVARFLLAAFVNTRTLVQLLILLAAGAFLYALQGMARALAFPQRFA